MGKFIIGLIIGLVIIPAGVFIYFKTGMAPVATDAQAMPFEKTLARWGLNARVEKEAPKTVPASVPANEQTYNAGVQVYREHCAVCHGVPNQPATAISRGEFPHPPQLFKGKGVTDDPPGETYWKVENGIRMTGMPAFKKGLTTDQMWQVSMLLANADKISAATKETLSQPLNTPMAQPPKQ